jgi:WD40 repeat protein
MFSLRVSSVIAVLLSVVAASGVQPRYAAAAPIEIAEVKREGDVDFEKDILPIFRRNCLACHSATEAQSDLVLESPQTILKGGSTGPAVVAGKSAESLLLKLAGKQKEPFMPPEDNDVKARPLTPQELGLLKLWIEQGAKGEVKAASSQIAWQPLPTGINPIYAVTITPDGQYAAASRANQIFLYHVPSKRELGRLTDPSLIDRGIYKQPGVADLDLVQSLKFSPDGTVLASGGFRTVKLWRKSSGGKQSDLAGLAAGARSVAMSPDGKLAAIGDETGKVNLFDLASGKILKVLEGHSGPVTGAAFTADGARLVTGSSDKSFRVWSVKDQQQIASIETPAAVSSIAIVGEGKLVAVGGEDHVIRLWELAAAGPGEAMKPVKELTGHSGAVTSLAPLEASGKHIVSGSKDGSLRIWDVAESKEVKSMQHGGPVEAVAARPDGKRLASVGSLASGKLWNAETGQQVAELKGDIRATLKVERATRSVSLAKKHVELAKKDLDEAKQRKTAEEDNQKKAGEAVTKAEGEFKPKEEAAKKAADEKAAVEKALAEAASVKEKSEEEKKAAGELLAKTDDALKSLKANQDAAGKLAGDDAVAAKSAAEKALADVEGLRKLLEPRKQAAEKSAEEKAAAFTQAEQKLKDSTASHQKAIDEQTAAQRTLDSAKRGVERAAEAVKKATEAIPSVETTVKAAEEAVKQRETDLTTATSAVKESEKPIHRVAFSPDGKFLATIGDSQLVHTWDGDSGTAIEVHEAGSAPAVIAIAGDGRAIVATADKAAAIWNFSGEWKLQRTIGSPDDGNTLADRVTALDFSPDGRLLAVGGGQPSRSGEVKLFNVEDGQLVRALKDPHSDTVNCLAFSPDGQQLASCAADRFVKLWNTADGSFIRSLEGHTHHVLGIAWRADGRMLVSGGADMVLKSWDTRTGDQLRTVQNQFTKEVTSVSFLADGELVVASGGDSRVRLINAASGNNQRDYSGASEYMYCVATSADGKTIIAGGLDSVVRIWNDEGKELAKFAPPSQPKDQTAAK